MADLGQLSALALAIWQHGLRARGASPMAVTQRIERALGQPFSPAAVSLACRELVRAGLADRSAFGYRELQTRQMELG